MQVADTEKKVEIYIREGYGEDWGLTAGPETLGLQLMYDLSQMHEESPDMHIACYIDGRLDHSYTPGSDKYYVESLDVVINGKTFVPE